MSFLKRNRPKPIVEQALARLQSEFSHMQTQAPRVLIISYRLVLSDDNWQFERLCFIVLLGECVPSGIGNQRIAMQLIGRY